MAFVVEQFETVRMAGAGPKPCFIHLKVLLFFSTCIGVPKNTKNRKRQRNENKNKYLNFKNIFFIWLNEKNMTANKKIYEHHISTEFLNSMKKCMWQRLRTQCDQSVKVIKSLQVACLHLQMSRNQVISSFNSNFNPETTNCDACSFNPFAVSRPTHPRSLGVVMSTNKSG